MAYLNQDQLNSLGLKSMGKNIKISDKASIYDAEKLEIGDYSRIDDFCVISGKIKIGRNVHITPQCLLAGGEPGLIIQDFATLSYGVKVFTQSDDYSGETMTNSTIPKKFKHETKQPVIIGRHTIVGAGSIIIHGVHIAEGNAIGAGSLVLESTEEWSVYVGSPARKIKGRRKELLELESQYLAEQ